MNLTKITEFVFQTQAIVWQQVRPSKRRQTHTCDCKPAHCSSQFNYLLTANWVSLKLIWLTIMLRRVQRNTLLFLFALWIIYMVRCKYLRVIGKNVNLSAAWRKRIGQIAVKRMTWRPTCTCAASSCSPPINSAGKMRVHRQKNFIYEVQVIKTKTHCSVTRVHCTLAHDTLWTCEISLLGGLHATLTAYHVAANNVKRYDNRWGRLKIP